jgi:hypothetical protein|nr:MAG TPA: hypothetical protein [Caudoviricetes sp.]
MEEKINIAEILKDKSEGTKLWTDMFGSVTLYVVTDACDAFQVKHHNKEPWFDKDGKLCKEGVLCIYPSKSMRDWSKFAWKKGDVLVSKDNVHIIFEKFEDDAYTRFKGKHYLWKYCDEEDYNKEETKMLTSVFEKANDDVAQTYIKTIEEKLGGKLNGETLEVEKAQQEFKNGDIVTIMPHIGDKLIYLFKAEDNEKYYGHAFLDGNIAIVNEDTYCQKDFSTARPSTEEEKQQLFSALAKKGKAWDAEKKEVADLKPKVKPFDRVLVRDSKSDNWRANLFGYIGKDGYYHCVYANWAYCIPYIGNESLLGTTKDVEG